MVISSSSTPRPFLLPIIILLIIISCSAAFSSADDDDDKPSDDHNLGHTCSGTTSDYSQSLTLLLGDLASNISPGNGGFSKASRPWAQGRVYGLAQCRGEVSVGDCKTCVNNAASAARQYFCPNKRSAIIWRDYCELKYSDVDFFGKIDTDNHLTITNGRAMSSGSQEVGNTLLRRLTQAAVESPGFFASGTSPAGVPQFMYGVAQCTRDLSKGDCKACLDRAVSDISKCCGNDSGVRVVFGSCNVRRELYPFLIGSDE